MSTEYALYVDPSLDVAVLRRLLFERVLSQPPPFHLSRWLMPYQVPVGRHIRVIVNHISRSVILIDHDIASHVLRTAILGFQTHRLSQPAAPLGWSIRSHRASRHRASRSNNVDQLKQCSICLESIFSHDMATLPCAHSFHEECIGRWIHRTPSCPLCREPLTQ